jgi:hypothetical protein
VHAHTSDLHHHAGIRVSAGLQLAKLLDGQLQLLGELLLSKDGVCRAATALGIGVTAASMAGAPWDTRESVRWPPGREPLWPRTQEWPQTGPRRRRAGAVALADCGRRRSPHPSSGRRLLAGSGGQRVSKTTGPVGAAPRVARESRKRVRACQIRPLTIRLSRRPPVGRQALTAASAFTRSTTMHTTKTPRRPVEPAASRPIASGCRRTS